MNLTVILIDHGAGLVAVVCRDVNIETGFNDLSALFIEYRDAKKTEYRSVGFLPA